MYVAFQCPVLQNLYYALFCLLDWKNAGWLWIAGKKVSGKWVWQGRVNSPLVAADWEAPQPDGNGPCLQLFDADRDYKWDDSGCNEYRNFVCELVM